MKNYIPINPNAEHVDVEMPLEQKLLLKRVNEILRKNVAHDSLHSTIQSLVEHTNKQEAIIRENNRVLDAWKRWEESQVNVFKYRKPAYEDLDD